MAPEVLAALEARWTQLTSEVGATAEECRTVFGDLTARYSSAGRHYHTLDHIAAVLRTLSALGADQTRDPALFLAAWFHDAVYDSRASDNEEQSAALASTTLTTWRLPKALIEETCRLILLTKTHLTAADDASGRRLLDADLAILAAEKAEYDAYASAIRREYAWVPEEAYRAGRRQVLERFLARPRLYWTKALHEGSEPQARRNLRREITGLGGAP
jgi:predicted metal-dependent HD superfamily phosphohydrolase